MQIDYEKLASIATDPTSRSTMAKDTSEVLVSSRKIKFLSPAQKQRIIISVP